MKTTKIDFRTKKVPTFFLLSGIILLFFSCDVMEPDADVLNPKVNTSEDQVFVLSSNSAFIDLNTRIKTNKPVRLNITSPTKHGSLADLGKGLLQYTPTAGKEAVQDAFEFTVFSEKDEIIVVDTVTINIEKDSTDLPCGIFPADDYAYGARKNVPFAIDVLSNDHICGVDSADLVVSIYRPDNTFPPHFGNAEVIGHMVYYTAGSAFEDLDKLIYKVHSAGEPGNAYYGVVYVAGEQPCDFFLKDDIFSFHSDSLSGVLVLPVLQNDSLCQSDNNYRMSIAQQPEFGTANIAGQAIAYEKTDTVIVLPSFNDYFLYEVCMDGQCQTARVDLKVRKDSSTCVLTALPDIIDLSSNTIPLIYLDVQFNDIICEGYSSFTITSSTQNGSAWISDKVIAYQRDPLKNKNDSLEYQLCNAARCSRAKVFIKREK